MTSPGQERGYNSYHARYHGSGQENEFRNKRSERRQQHVLGPPKIISSNLSMIASLPLHSRSSTSSEFTVQLPYIAWCALTESSSRHADTVLADAQSACIYTYIHKIVTEFYHININICGRCTEKRYTQKIRRIRRT